MRGILRDQKPADADIVIFKCMGIDGSFPVKNVIMQGFNLLDFVGKKRAYSLKWVLLHGYISRKGTMEDHFKIHIEQLREGHEEKIHEKLDPGFLEIQEPDLVFDCPVELEGVAYLAEQELVFHWDIRTEALVPCSICNEPVRVLIHIQNFYASVSVKEIKTGIYNFKDLLRETILLEVPSFAECTGGKCPQRQEYKKFLKEPSNPSSDEEAGYHPFADLDWKP